MTGKGKNAESHSEVESILIHPPQPNGTEELVVVELWIAIGSEKG